MSPTPITDHTPLTEHCGDEVVTQVRREILDLPGTEGKVAVLTLHNDADKRPETLGPRSIDALLEAIGQVRELAEEGRVQAVMIEGSAPTFAAGVDLSLVRGLRGTDAPLEMIGSMGHEFVEAIRELPVPTLARVTGTALGGGLELALAADYRIGHPGTRNIGLPEIRLGLFPGWAGIFDLPRLIGPEQAVTVIFENPLNSNRTLNSEQAREAGILDALTQAGADDDAAARAEALAWFGEVVAGRTEVHRPEAADPDAALFAADTGAQDDPALRERWEQAVTRARQVVARKTAGASDAANTALELFAVGPQQTRADSRAAQIEAMGELVAGDQLPSALYAMLDLVTHRARNPSMVPPSTEPRRIGRVGVVGAGLMASQLALLFLTRLKVPVMISDVEQSRVDHGLETIRGELEKLVAKGRLTEEQAGQLGELVSGTVDTAEYADCDLVIEAVFEETSVKKEVFANLERSVREDCILATNTSSLLVSEMVEDLAHPERVIGFHFFNPVAVMPLVEIVRTEHTDDQAVATAFDLAKRLGKVAVGARDSSGFIVNRILGVVLSEVGRDLDEGAPAQRISEALRPLGLPMDAFTLIDLVGLPIGVHLLESLRTYQGERFHVSGNFRRLAEEKIRPIADRSGGLTPQAQELIQTEGEGKDAETIRTDAEDALAREITRMLEEGVVPDRADIDLAMILGANWPFFNGGITRYLDRVDAFDRI